MSTILLYSAPQLHHTMVLAMIDLQGYESFWSWQTMYLFDRKLRSGLSKSFILLLLLHAFGQILILDKKTGKSYLG